jgi:sulfite reductase (NADPH) hemoprotein beta-component
MTLPTAGARGTFADPREIDPFVAALRRFERGEIDAEQWRAHRVVHGIHAQRQDDAYMLRVKIPQGIASADQLRALADVAARFSRGFGHLTTRQNFQVHFVRPAHLEPALRRLAEAGITTVAAGGNAVRNVVACPLAGVAPDEVFDPTPYAEAVTRHFLRHPLASSLPRKFKIAFEGCAGDHVGTAIQDLGLRAALRDGRRGFAAAIAGGTSSACTSAALLLEFLPAGDVLALAEAIIRVFHARGDRRNKQRNRLKYLVRDLGLGPFRALVEEALAKVRAEGAPRCRSIRSGRPPRSPRHARPAPPRPAEIAARVLAAPPRGPGSGPWSRRTSRLRRPRSSSSDARTSRAASRVLGGHRGRAAG